MNGHSFKNFTNSGLAALIFLSACSTHQANKNSKFPYVANKVAGPKQFEPIDNSTVQRSPAGLVETPSYGFKLIWSDEFNGAQEAINKGEDPACFDSKPLICKRNYWWTGECDEVLKDPRNQAHIDDESKTRDLNKCVWAVYNGTHGGGKPTLATHDANMVEVKDGNLILYAKKNPKTYDTYDCGIGSPDLDIGNLGSWAEHYSARCKYIKGAVDSNPVQDRLRGFATQYGRIEVRAKLPDSPGSWPAHWMMPSDESKIPPQYRGWPEAGEIDIMEMFNQFDEVSQTYHNGDQATSTHFWKGKDWKTKKKYYPHLKTKKQRYESFTKEYHTFAVEWEQDELRFYVDNYLVNRIVEGEQDSRRFSHGFIGRYKIPEWPFFMILNHGIENVGKKKNYPTDKNWKDSAHYIDYVRAYRACSSSETNCTFFNKTYISNSICPKSMRSIGTYEDGMPICENYITLKVEKDKCIADSGIIHNGHCLENIDGKYFKARVVKDSGKKCPLGGTHVGTYLDGLAMCKPLVASKMTNRLCNGLGGVSYQDYCLRLVKDHFYKANPIKADDMKCPMNRKKLGEYQGMPICKVLIKIKREKCTGSDVLLKPEGQDEEYCLSRDIDWYKAKRLK